MKNEIIKKINDWRREENLPTYNKIIFVLNKDIEKTTDLKVYISAKKIINPNEVENVIQKMLKGGPSWLHAEVLFAEDDTMIITLNSGAPVGAPKPSINLSMANENKPRVKIIK